MENLNLHKLKLFAIIVAGVALIAMILPWQVVKAVNYGGFNFPGVRRSVNGFAGWGWISLLGIIAVVVGSLLGDKTKSYDAQSKLIAMAGFGGVALGAVLFMMRVLTVGRGTSLGFGLIICLLAAIAGLALVAGVVKVPANIGGGSTSGPRPPSPPPPTV